MFFAALLANGVFVMRMAQDAENLGDLLSYTFKVIPSFALSDSLLYSFNRADLNKTRNYTEAEIWLANYKRTTLPERTNITLQAWDLPNMGGDLISMGGNALIFGVVLILIETGCLSWAIEAVVNRCKRNN